eukprot:256019_1
MIIVFHFHCHFQTNSLYKSTKQQVIKSVMAEQKLPDYIANKQSQIITIKEQINVCISRPEIKANNIDNKSNNIIKSFAKDTNNGISFVDHPYSPIHKNDEHKSLENINRKIRNNSFDYNKLQPVFTPKPSSISMDDISDDSEHENENDNPIPSDDDIIAQDHYIAKQQQTFDSKESEYCAYQIDQKENINEIISKRNINSDELQGKYEYIRCIGAGSFGYVAEAKDLKTGKRVAIKKLFRVFYSIIDAKRLLRELKICRLLSGHRNIVEFINIIQPNDPHNFHQLILVFEFCDTNLQSIIKSNQFLTVTHIQYILYQILIGLKFMHSLNIYHRDLKPENILFNADCTVKICDFGLSRSTNY